MSRKNALLGSWGEKTAAKYLHTLGWLLIHNNFQTEHGEIDLIAQNGDVLVFIEVKTRRTLQYGYPETAVHQEKIDHLLAAAEFYLQHHTDGRVECRFDVISIYKPAVGNPLIHHVENAIGYN